MKVVKKTADYTIMQRRDSRYAVTDANKKALNGEEKVKILAQEGLITLPEPKAPEPEPVAEEATQEEAADAESEAEAKE